MSSLAPLLQAFFTDRMITQRQSSSNTIASYRDTFTLLLRYVCDLKNTTPSRVEIGDVDADTITGFLHYLEESRGNSVRTRNTRLAAIHSLFGYAALSHREHAEVIQRVLAIPSARMHRNIVTWLEPAEHWPTWPGPPEHGGRSRKPSRPAKGRQVASSAWW